MVAKLNIFNVADKQKTDNVANGGKLHNTIEGRLV